MILNDSMADITLLEVYVIWLRNFTYLVNPVMRAGVKKIE